MANSIIVNDKDRFIEYRYSITEFYMVINGESIEFPVERISGMKIENYYNMAIFPIFKVTVLIEPSRYYAILKNKDNVKFKIRVQSYFNDVDKPENKSMLRDVINDVFILFPDESNEDFEKELKKDAKTNKDENELDKTTNPVELFLFRDSIVTGLRKTFNTVLKNCDLITTVVYLLNKAGVKNVLLSPFDNTAVYDHIVIPPLTIEKQLRYLNNNYGFHKNGTMIFFGLTNSYILNYTGTCTACKQNEWEETVIYILEKSNPQSALSSAIKKYNEKRFYINITTNDIEINSGVVSSNVIHGTDAMIVNVNKGDSTHIKTNVNTVGEHNTAVIYNTTSNEYMPNVYKIQKNSDDFTLSIVMRGISIEAFNPNKGISVIFESPTLNSKYKGKYRVVAATNIFNGSALNFEVMTSVELKRIE